jgi:uncharacterized RDD family membrane protein YckC
MVDARTAAGPAEAKSQAYGGFWRRFIAWIIDWIIISTCVSIVFLLIAAVVPGFGNAVRLQVPFGLFTVERTLESKTTDSTDSTGATVTTTESLVEETILGKWTYRYRVTKTVKKGPGSSYSTTTEYQRIDPVTKQDISGTGLDKLILIVLVIYWILMESSRYQASFGKLAFGMKVVNRDGSRLSIPTATVRNLLKLLSAIILFIGFMMAGWTRHKQALHDKIARCYVVMDR